MAVNNPRNKVLIFRLTQDEYATLQAASSAQGARSLSDFARSKLLGSEHAPAVERQLAELKTTVARIAGLLEDRPAPLAGAVRNGSSPELAAPLVSPLAGPLVGPLANAENR